MKPWSILLLVIAGLAVLALMIDRTTMSAPVESSPVSKQAKTNVIVELFTSEGCSSCPPADAVLDELEKTQSIANTTIIALGEHVDYWNYLGWADPFSSATYSERQQNYARALNADTYTPQMVIDGQIEFVGSNSSRAQSAIAKAAQTPKANVTITRLKPDTFKITATDIPRTTPNNKLDIIVALTESNLSSQVARGENAGRKLQHRTVVRQLLIAGEAPTAEAKLNFDPKWKSENLRVVAFLQERMSRRILGATVLNAVEMRP